MSTMVSVLTSHALQNVRDANPRTPGVYKQNGHLLFTSLAVSLESMEYLSEAKTYLFFGSEVIELVL